MKYVVVIVAAIALSLFLRFVAKRKRGNSNKDSTPVFIHVQAPEGWEKDTHFSERFSFTAFVPKGHGFKTSETVMYAQRHRKGQGRNSLEEFIKQYMEIFSINDSTRILQAADLRDGNNNSYISYYLFPKREQPDKGYSRVSCGDEADSFIAFTLLSRTEEGLKANEKSYKEMIKGYKP